MPTTKPDFYEEEQSALSGAFSRYDMEAIYSALTSMKHDDVYLEIGVMDGRSLNFARKFSKGDVFGIDINDYGTRVEGANFIHKNSNEAVDNWKLPIKVLFIDGDHSYEQCLKDWQNYSPFIVKGGWVFFHDCDNTSPGVVRVFDEIDKTGWKNVKKHPEERCSMAWMQKK